MKKSGYSKGRILTMWVAVLVISTLCSGSGYVFMENASDSVMTVIASFAGGGIIAMVTSTMMPEAYEDGGPIIGLLAALGLLTSLVLDHL